ncbi:MAG: selenium-binding family protein [Clostridia bacterium]|nr:selenium-binding family protein [Clostridia bacterium]
MENTRTSTKMGVYEENIIFATKMGMHKENMEKNLNNAKKLSENIEKLKEKGRKLTRSTVGTALVGGLAAGAGLLTGGLGLSLASIGVLGLAAVNGAKTIKTNLAKSKLEKEHDQEIDLLNKETANHALSLQSLMRSALKNPEFSPTGGMTLLNPITFDKVGVIHDVREKDGENSIEGLVWYDGYYEPGFEAVKSSEGEDKGRLYDLGFAKNGFELVDEANELTC